jgi:GT2 family glycosyltransferase
MDAQEWRTQQRRLREALRAERRCPSEHESSPASEAPAVHPLVSVIVVAWNAEEVLPRCLEQLLVQDHPSYEIVVVDDGSQDRTFELARRAQGNVPVTVLRSRANRGCPHARNLGLRAAKGEIIAFIDADGFAAPSWLSELVARFGSDPDVGGVASTVFFANNPLVLNGAGGTVNRQGWAADLSMNEPYEHAELASEALYPMGCGMAVRRAAVERVGPFDDRMLNYYDDVDYGIRLWRAGYRVLVAKDAWIDHGFGQSGDRSGGPSGGQSGEQSGGDSAHKRLLCERHRMRVVLKHAPLRTLRPWVRHELRSLRLASRSGRALKLRAVLWNASHLPSTLGSRWALRGASGLPTGLIDPSWGDGYPWGIPPIARPHPEDATNTLDMADPCSEGQLLYGWFPRESRNGRSYRWAGAHAAALISLPGRARRLRIDYSHVPVDSGAVDVRVRQVGAPDPQAWAWSTRLSWQYIERSVENHPLALPAGDYEVLFSAQRPWSDPPRENRQLGLALARLSFDASYEILPGGLDMASSDVEERLVSGWFEAERSESRAYRWAGVSAAAVLRLDARVSRASLSYRLPPASIGALRVEIAPIGDSGAPLDGHSRRIGNGPPGSSAGVRIEWSDGEWHERSFAAELGPGTYLVSFRTDTTWSNADGRDPDLWPEARSLGAAVAALSLD